MPSAGDGQPCSIGPGLGPGNELPGAGVVGEFLALASYKREHAGRCTLCVALSTGCASGEGAGRQYMEADLLDSDQKM